MPEKTHYEGTPSGSVILMWIFSRSPLGLLIFIFLFYLVFMIATRTFTIGVFFPLLLIGFVVLIVLLYLMLLWKTYHYKITDRGVYFTGGIIIRRKRYVPLYKITDVETSQNIFEQILGINKLSFFTAGTAQLKAEIVFEGIRDPKRLSKTVHQLMEKVQKSATRYSE